MSACISWLNSVSEVFVGLATRMLVQSSVLIVILLLLDLVLRRRVRAVVRYWIWLLVLVKLLLPPSLSSPVSLVSWIGDRLPAAATAPFVPDPAVVARSVIAPSMPLPVGTAPLAAAAVSPRVAEVPFLAITAPPTISPTWQTMVLLAWAAAVVLTLLLLWQRVSFVRALVAQSREAPDDLTALLEQCRRQIGVHSAVGIRVTCLSASPSVCGLRRPVILMPEHMAQQLQAPQLRSVLLHELAHIKRGDLWVSLLQTLLQIVYLYHPLLWLANVQIRRIREQAVDEAVLAALGEEAEDYPRTLLSISKLAFGQPALSLRLLGVVESKRALTARVRHIVSRPFPTSARLGLLSLAAIAVIGAVLLPMARAAERRTRDLPAGQPAGPSAAAPHGGVTVGLPGVVVDEQGKAVSGARVVLYHFRSRSGLDNRVVDQTRTDARGRFALTRPLTYQNNGGTTYTDHYLLFATHPDFALAWQVIAGGAEKDECRLTLTPPATQAFSVTDRAGHPLARAQVWIYQAGRSSDVNPLMRSSFILPQDIGLLTGGTDEQGRTTVTNLPRTSCSFYVSMPGYSDVWKSVGVPSTREAHVAMTRAGTVTGRVLTRDGQPVVGARVSFEANWGPWHFHHALTDETGRFSNDKLVARGGFWFADGGTGQYKVTLSHRACTAPEQLVQVEPGQVVQDFNFEAVEGTLLRVRVLEPETERPICGARLLASSASGRFEGYTDANGVCEQRMLNGQASVSFTSPPDGTYVIEGRGSARVEALAGGGVEELTLHAPSRLHSLVAIKGRVRLPDGTPAAGIRISTTNKIATYRTATFGGTGSAYTRTNPDGSFELKGVPRDVDVFLYGETKDYAYILAEVLDPAQASPELARPLIMQPGGQASVLLTDASGKPRVNMALKIRPRKWDNYVFFADDRPAATDAAGRLNVDGIVPGLEYFICDAKASLGESGGWDLYNENRVLLAADARSTAPAASPATAEPAGGEISGEVVDPQGKPIVGAHVTVENKDLLLLPQSIKLGAQIRQVIRPDSTLTDAQGRFHFTDLTPGQTGLSARAPGYRTSYLWGIATGAPAVTFVLREPCPYPLSGVVVDISRRPVPGVEVTFVEEIVSGPEKGKSGPPVTMRTDSDGVFRLGRLLSPVDGRSVRRLLFARKPGYGAFGNELDSTGGQTAVSIKLMAEERISGVVKDETGVPIAGATVLLYSGWGYFGSFRFGPMWQHLAPQAATQADGSFTLNQLPTASDLSLQVRADGYASGGLWPVRTGKFGTYAIRRGDSTIVMGGSGDPNAPLTITLSRAVTLRGTVVYEGTGRPAEAIRVATQAKKGGGWSEAVTDAGGRFEMTGVSPASCNLLVLVANAARSSMPEWTAAAIPLDDLKPAETRAGLRLVLTKGDLLRGRATDAQGQPLQGIDIAFYSAARPRSGAACQSIDTAADGTWSYRFPPGEVLAYVRTTLSGASWTKKGYTYNLTAGQTVGGVDFVLDRAVPQGSRYRGVPPAAATPERGRTVLPPGATVSPRTQWPASEGGNGHFYQAVRMPKPLLWNEADRLAQALGGHLVTITSEAENQLIFRLIDNDTYWFHSYNWRGPWIGALQPPGSPEPAGGWAWVTGEPFTYALWDEGQPNNFNGSPENRLVFGNQRSRIPTWNDVREDFAEVISFVVEWDQP